MQVVALKSPIVSVGDDLWQILRQTLPEKIPEQSVVAVTSKIISLSQKRVVAIPKDEEKAKLLEQKLVEQESDFYCRGSQKYHSLIGWRDGHYAGRAGIDRSNTGGYFVLWPKDLQACVNQIWRWLRQEYQVKQVGVMMTDSHVNLGERGVIGTVLAHCGFAALNDKIGQTDLFGQPFTMTKVAVSQALAVAAVYQMGETSERTPVALLTQLRDLAWQDRIPTPAELRELKVSPEEDLFADFFRGPEWHQGKHQS